MMKSSDSKISRPKLRWYQYSLRTLFIVMIICQIACCYLACLVNKARQRRAAIEMLKKSEEYIGYDEGPSWLRSVLGEDIFLNVYDVTIRSGPNDQSKANDTDVELIAQFPEIKDLTIHDAPNISDAGIKILKNLKSLQMLDLQGCENISDLSPIANLPHLQELRLGGCKVSSLKSLGSPESLPQLEKLELDGTPIKDDELVNLKGLKQLKKLSLMGATNITGKGLGFLRELPHLEVCNVALNNNFTDEDALLKMPNSVSVSFSCTRVSAKCVRKYYEQKKEFMEEHVNEEVIIIMDGDIFDDLEFNKTGKKDGSIKWSTKPFQF
jgi:hypothetical protein